MNSPTAPSESWSPLRIYSRWREVMMPKEHGSWSLAFEPVVLGLLAAPSAAGGFLALAVAAGFFCRRPLRIALHDAQAERRRIAWSALGCCAIFALAALGAAVVIAGAYWLVWLLPAWVGGVVFSIYDLRNDGREEVAEIAGSAAFASLPGTFATLGGWSASSAATLSLLMIGRAVPTVIFVRAAVRGRKSGRTNFTAAWGAAIAALGLAAALTWLRLAPPAGVVLFILFLGRIAVVHRRPDLRAKQLGIIEAVAGIVFVVTLALAWTF